jgi:hypothetical protein
MAILEGDRLTDRLTGQSFIVKKIIDKTIILEAEGSSNRFYLGDAVVELLFERAQEKKDLN